MAVGKNEAKKRILVYYAIIALLTLIILFFILEFRFVKGIIDKNEDNVRQIVLNELNVYLHGLQYATEDAAKSLGRVDEPERRALLRDIAARSPAIEEIYLLNYRGEILNSLSGKEVGMQKPLPAVPDRSGYEIIKNGRVAGLGLAAPITGGSAGPGYLIIEYNTSDFQNNFLLKYSTDKLKVGVAGRAGHFMVWPFDREALNHFNPERESIKAQGSMYLVSQVSLDDFPCQVFFFDQDHNFDTYRIITIMFLLFMLYFLIYQFIIELLQLNSINSYFDNIDFNIFNNLKEGIIIANQFGKVVFANGIIYEIFAEKRIVFNETRLKEIIGPIDGPDRIMLKKTGDLLEIVSFPIVKNGKMLGSMVVISPSREKEKLRGYALGGIVELLQEGVIFVDRENKIMVFNMMAVYYLGHMTNEMNINEVNAELANLIESNIGSPSLTRAGLSCGDVHCELKPVYGANGSYAGTIVFIR